ncbi:hypothetical protein MettiDRAFT_1260 [Methanolobus tindarius DSM 2278]|jgi:hypothetical protein|uniref:DUF3800 domain-containing protein n=1 Tax=Methanolobus tindarius DSM 2278 TaxID=1090322 RepID=W9DQW7_METTI|nr:DUF3800 domain-containing protein [Methanolobus tindarius]ETA67825.1 hypothetical protein MettiDRAFT_1260 [Methanolobus tindarius DSM 2278]
MFAENEFQNIEIEIYSDEIHSFKDEKTGHEWLFMGALIVPIQNKNEILNDLKNLRCLGNNKDYDNENCPYKCKFHKKNNTEIHFKELDNHMIRCMISKKWIRYLRLQTKKSPKFYLNILGINITGFDKDGFGGKNEKWYLNLYNRFYRTLLEGAFSHNLKKYNQITISKICHDVGPQEKHDYFNYHIFQKLMEKDRYIISEDGCNKVFVPTIEFIESDHRKSEQEESNFIQLVDIILGSTKQCLFNTSKKKEKREVAFEFTPILESIMYEENKRYLYNQSNFERLFSISFFKKGLDLDFQERFADDGDKYNSKFFNYLPIRNKDPKMKTLDDFY